MRLDDPRLTALVGDTAGLSAVVSFVEESADHRLFIAAALLEDGRIRHVHRKLYLPTYGLFDERRFFAPGEIMCRAVPSRLGVGVGLAVCEDFWHLSVAQVLALDGAQLLINVSSRTRSAATNEVGLGTATSWRTLMRTYAQLTTSFVVFCNRVGIDESIAFWGGSEVIAPTGAAVFSAPLYDEGLFCVDVDLADVRRERIALPLLLRDERPELVVHEWRRLVLERAGLAADSTAEPGAMPGLDVAAEELLRGSAARDAPARDEGSRDHHQRAALRPAGRAVHRHRRRPSGHRGVHPRPAPPGRPRADGVGPVRRHRFGARGVPRGGGDRRRPVAGRPHALPDIVAGVARRRGRGRGPSWAGVRGRGHQPDGRPPSTPTIPRRRRCARATSWPASGWPSSYDRSVTWGGLVVGTGNKTESLIGYTTLFGDSACAFNPIGDLYKSQVRQLAIAVDVPQAIIAGPVGRPRPGQTDEHEGGFARSSTASCSGGSTSGAPSTRSSPWASSARRSSESTGWSPVPSSSGRCRRSPNSGRERRA